MPVTVFRSESQIISADSVKQHTLKQSRRGAVSSIVIFKYPTTTRTCCWTIQQVFSCSFKRDEDVAESREVLHYERKVPSATSIVTFFSYFFWASSKPCLIESIFPRVSSRAPGPNQAGHCLSLEECATQTAPPSTNFFWFFPSFSDYSPNTR